MHPQMMKFESMAQAFDDGLGVGAAKEDHPALQRPLVIEREVPGKRPAFGCDSNTASGLPPCRGQELLRAVLQLGQVLVDESAPHRPLPASVERLDLGLESRLPGRGEDRRDIPAADTAG
jgi:hypothetical protein